MATDSREELYERLNSLQNKRESVLKAEVKLSKITDYIVSKLKSEL